MNYIICKYGQKVIFDRNSDECNRSNTNGNVSLYKLLKLIFEKNSDDIFSMVSKVDDLSMFPNAFDLSNVCAKEMRHLKKDYLIVIAGLGEYEKDERLIEIINEVKVKKFILIAEDPRCISSMSNDVRLTRIPDLIITQTRKQFLFKEKEVNTVYVPIQTCDCYCVENSGKFEKKDNKNLLIISNTSGKEYDRPKIVYNLIRNITSYNVYGRLSDDDKRLFKKDSYIGEVNYKEITNVLNKSLYTLVVPIAKNWVTTKYVECLNNNCLPIFYKDYDLSLLDEDMCVQANKRYLTYKYCIGTSIELKETIDMIKRNDKQTKDDIMKLYNMLIKPYVNGVKLNEKLMKAIKE